jgi:3-isopropylmalate/(R)-2-methylmalate dehydratase small subunit
MEKIEIIQGTTLPLPIKNVDTDMIIPAQYLTSTSSSGYGAFLFKRLREQDVNFPFNDPRYKDSSIIVAHDNFGCGSSREHAVWALRDAGIKAVIAPSFADIFRNNCGKNGFLTIVLPSDVVEFLITRTLNTDSLQVTIDLKKLKVFVNDSFNAQNGQLEYDFPFDEFRRHCFLNGLDDLDYLLSHLEDIRQFTQVTR